MDYEKSQKPKLRYLVTLINNRLIDANVYNEIIPFSELDFLLLVMQLALFNFYNKKAAKTSTGSLQL